MNAGTDKALTNASAYGVSRPNTSEKPNDSFANVKTIVSHTLNDGAEYAVYLYYPQKPSGVFLHNSRRMRSASMIKVFILAAAMEKVHNGEISLEESVVLNSSDKTGGSGILSGYPSGSRLTLRELLKLMITESDNTAANIVIRKIGMAEINGYIWRNGYADTVLQRKMMDTAATAAGRENYTSVNDLGRFFTKLYHHSCVSREHDETMLGFLKRQKDTDCFPAALPGLTIAHKTGALPGVYDDGGIIYNGSHDAILVIMTENCGSKYSAIEHMKEFAKEAIRNYPRQ